jgi:hypothetical protein
MKRLLIAILILILFGTCKEKYVSPANTPETGYLVVEGVINAGTGLTNIVLKRTTKLDSTSIVYEKGATVFVEAENNTKFNLQEASAGNYSALGLGLINSIKYRLNIFTLDGKKYQSDFISVQSTPPIDSVSWKQDSLGAHFFINTHDPTNKTKYYQWDYTETWEYHSPYLKYYKYVPVASSNGQKYTFTVIDPIRVSFDSTIIKCWQEDFSNAILIGSTISLSDNKILLSLNFIPAGSIKLAVLYCLNTRQYSLSLGKYQFLQKMKKNTESSGSVFDAQPSELIGNIHCITNPSDPVIGYLDICQIQESRIFISNSQLQKWDYKPTCVKREFLNDVDSITLAKAMGLEPVFESKPPIIGPPPFGFPGTYYYTTPECIDCTLTGTNVKPSYWR